MPDPAASETTLVVRRVISAPADAVYRAWTDPVFVRQWSWGSEHETLRLDLDYRVGGRWKQEIRNRRSGEVWSLDAVIQEIIPDRRLVHTFLWRSDKGVVEGPSVVAIDFLGSGLGQTEVIITHSRLAVTSEAGTRSGWEDILEVIVHSIIPMVFPAASRRSSATNAASGS